MKNQNIHNIDISIPFDSTLEALGDAAIDYVLNKTGNKPSETWRQLDIGRSTLYRWLSSRQSNPVASPETPSLTRKIRIKANSLAEAELIFIRFVYMRLKSPTETARHLEMGRSTFYRRLNEFESAGLQLDVKMLDQQTYYQMKHAAKLAIRKKRCAARRIKNTQRRKLQRIKRNTIRNQKRVLTNALWLALETGKSVSIPLKQPATHTPPKCFLTVAQSNSCAPASKIFPSLKVQAAESATPTPLPVQVACAKQSTNPKRPRRQILSIDLNHAPSMMEELHRRNRTQNGPR